MTKFNRNKLRGRIVELYGTQTKFAKEVDSTQMGISIILTGRSNPNSETIYLWAKALKLQTEEIGEYFFTPEIKETF